MAQKNNLHGESKKIIVIVHVYYLREWTYINDKLGNLDGIKYDLYITISEDKEDLKNKIFTDRPMAQIKIVKNKGRDMLPFMQTINALPKNKYMYLLKLHTKRSNHRHDGSEWFANLVDKLLPSSKRITRIIEKLEKEANAVGPSGHYVELDRYIGGNSKSLNKLLEKVYGIKEAQKRMNSLKDAGFFAGSMFWIRFDKLRPLIDLKLTAEDFESEKGQLDTTMAHTLERFIFQLPGLETGNIYQSSRWRVKKVTKWSTNRRYKHAVNK